MTESVHAQQILLAALAGAMVVICGAAHALFLAFAKLQGSRKLMRVSWLAYALFVMAVLVLAWTLHLSGFWILLVIAMLTGYLLAPHGIWHLSVATHLDEKVEPAVGSQTLEEGGTDHD